MKLPNHVYFLLAITLIISTSFLSGCTTEETTQTKEVKTVTQTTTTETPKVEPTKTEETTSQTTTETQSTTPTQTTTSETVSKNVYKNGTFTEEGGYISPGGPETITVSLSIENDTVKKVTLTSTTKIEKSKTYQGLFLEGLNKEIVGKKLSDIGTFSRLNGSSLTGKGFNIALKQIETDAKI